ncbi:MAG TPA: ABC transporter substrate-binding protein [Ramlibacter sp.]|nr:ABC transporter substrate-binding protein [Ramlibacter sp.]
MSSPLRISRRAFAQAGVGIAAAIALPGLRAQGPRLEKPRLTMAVGGKSAFHCLPLIVAEQLGYFRSEGLELEIVDAQVGAMVLDAVSMGAADFACGAFEHTIVLQGRGQFYQSVVLLGRAPQIALGVSARALPNYRAIADLRGRRIGVSSPGSSTSMVASMVLARAGVSPADVSFVGVGTAANALTALRSGQIDAMSNIDPVMTMLEQRGEVRIITDTRTLKGTQEVFGGPMPAACVYASQDFVQKHPATCQAVANGVVHALKWLQTAGPGDLIKAVPEAYLLGDRALYLASFAKGREGMSPDGLMAEDGARTALRALGSFDSGVRTDTIQVGRTFTNDFARRAKDKFRA